MKKVNLKILNMSCSHCEDKIRKEIKQLMGVKTINISFKTKEAEILYDENKIKEIEILETIKKLNYRSEVINENKNRKISFKDILPMLAIILIVYLIIKNVFGFNFVNYLPSFTDSTSVFVLLLIGLTTSVHCVTMCGSINVFVSSNSSSFKDQAIYNFGRVVSYTLIGGLFGLLGSVISINTKVQGMLTFIIAFIMLILGLSMINALPQIFYKLIPRFKFLKIKKANTPFLIGLLNGLMPCGPLQTMQLYALTTGSLVKGAVSMFFFALGTVPLMLGVGEILRKLKMKFGYIMHKISASLIIFLAVLMMIRSFNYWGVTFDKLIYSSYKDYLIAEVKDDVQYIETDLKDFKYKNILVQKGIPVKFNIKVDNYQRYGCINSILIPSQDIKYDLQNGDNIIEFIYDEEGTYKYTCWMGMVSANIKVVDNLNEIKEALNE